MTYVTGANPTDYAKGTGEATYRLHHELSGTPSARDATDLSATPSELNKSSSTSKERIRVDGEVRHGKGQLDRRALDQAVEALESLDPGDPDTFLIRLTALSGIACELWRSAAQSSVYHRQLLAAVESAIRAGVMTERISTEQVRAMRQAFIDLGSPVLAQANVDSIGSYLIDEGYSPLAIVGELEQQNDDSVTE